MGEAAIHLIVVSPLGLVFDGFTTAVVLPGSKGSFEVLKDHAPLISSLEKGDIRYYEDGVAKYIPIESGFVEVLDNEVSVAIEQ